MLVNMKMILGNQLVLHKADFFDAAATKSYPKGDAQVLFILDDSGMVHHGIHDNDLIYEGDRRYPIEQVLGWMYYPICEHSS